jgi:hypothetical protein
VLVEGGGEEAREERGDLLHRGDSKQSEQHKVKYEGVKIVIIIKKLEVMQYPYYAT